MSEFELSVLRQQSLEAIRQKARRGELRFCLPVGYCRGSTDAIEFDPDLRVQNAIRLVFDKFQQCGTPARCCCGSARNKSRCRR
jgi:DNA invertase Pin-like site-specific DNA recombinase